MVAPMSLFEYAVLRAVPRVERGEFVNVGVVLYSQELDFLAAQVRLDERRLLAVDPAADVPAVRAALDAVRRTCEGTGPAGRTPLGQRFGWLTAPRSTVLQAGPVHTGMTDDPRAELDRLLDKLVR